MKDEAEQQAEMILCKWSDAALPEHVRASLQVHIAAALREAQAERDAQSKAAGHWMREANKEHNDNHRLADERDAAYVRGLERALELMRAATFYGEGITAILTEITSRLPDEPY